MLRKEGTGRKFLLKIIYLYALELLKTNTQQSLWVLLFYILNLDGLSFNVRR